MSEPMFWIIAWAICSLALLSLGWLSGKRKGR